MKTKQKSPTISSLHKKLWKLVSEYTRRKDAVDDMNTCYTCGSYLHWKELQAGHFISRRHKSTLYDLEDNIRPQCVGCNIFRSGEQFKFGEKLRKEIGEEAFQALIKRSQEIKQFRAPELEAMILEYKEILRTLP